MGSVSARLDGERRNKRLNPNIKTLFVPGVFMNEKSFVIIQKKKTC